MSQHSGVAIVLSRYTQHRTYYSPTAMSTRWLMRIQCFCPDSHSTETCNKSTRTRVHTGQGLQLPQYCSHTVTTKANRKVQSDHPLYITGHGSAPRLAREKTLTELRWARCEPRNALICLLNLPLLYNLNNEQIATKFEKKMQEYVDYFLMSFLIIPYRPVLIL